MNPVKSTKFGKLLTNMTTKPIIKNENTSIVKKEKQSLLPRIHTSSTVNNTKTTTPAPANQTVAKTTNTIPTNSIVNSSKNAKTIPVNSKINSPQNTNIIPIIPIDGLTDKENTELLKLLSDLNYEIDALDYIDYNIMKCNSDYKRILLFYIQELLKKFVINKTSVNSLIEEFIINIDLITQRIDKDDTYIKTCNYKTFNQNIKDIINKEIIIYDNQKIINLLSEEINTINKFNCNLPEYYIQDFKSSIVDIKNIQNFNINDININKHPFF